MGERPRHHADEEQEREQLLETLMAERAAAARREILEAVLPAVDGVDKAIASGERYLRVRDRAAEVSDLTREQAMLVSPSDRAMLSGWLDGLRLVRDRLLAILESGAFPSTSNTRLAGSSSRRQSPS